MATTTTHQAATPTPMASSSRSRSRHQPIATATTAAISAGSTCSLIPLPITARKGSEPRWPLYSAAWVAAKNGWPEPTQGGTNHKNGIESKPATISSRILAPANCGSRNHSHTA